MLFYETNLSIFFVRIYSPVNYSYKFIVVSLLQFICIFLHFMSFYILYPFFAFSNATFFQTLKIVLKSFSHIETNRFYHHKSKWYSKTIRILNDIVLEYTKFYTKLENFVLNLIHFTCPKRSTQILI